MLTDNWPTGNCTTVKCKGNNSIEVYWASVMPRAYDGCSIGSKEERRAFKEPQLNRDDNNNKKARD